MTPPMRVSAALLLLLRAGSGAAMGVRIGTWHALPTPQPLPTTHTRRLMPTDGQMATRALSQHRRVERAARRAEWTGGDEGRGELSAPAPTGAWESGALESGALLESGAVLESGALESGALDGALESGALETYALGGVEIRSRGNDEIRRQREAARGAPPEGGGGVGGGGRSSRG